MRDDDNCLLAAGGFRLAASRLLEFGLNRRQQAEGRQPPASS